MADDASATFCVAGNKSPIRWVRETRPTVAQQGGPSWGYECHARRFEQRRRGSYVRQVRCARHI